MELVLDWSLEVCVDKQLKMVDAAAAEVCVSVHVPHNRTPHGSSQVHPPLPLIGALVAMFPSGTQM